MSALLLGRETFKDPSNTDFHIYLKGSTDRFFEFRLYIVRIRRAAAYPATLFIFLALRIRLTLLPLPSLFSLPTHIILKYTHSMSETISPPAFLLN
jgi:hypothetical protein